MYFYKFYKEFNFRSYFFLNKKTIRLNIPDHKRPSLNYRMRLFKKTNFKFVNLLYFFVLKFL